MTFQGTPICKNRLKKRYQELPASGRPSQSHTSSVQLVQVRLGEAPRHKFLKPESCKTTMPIVSARCQNPISIFGWVQTDTQRRQEAVECAVNGAQPVNRMTVK